MKKEECRKWLWDQIHMTEKQVFLTLISHAHEIAEILPPDEIRLLHIQVLIICIVYIIDEDLDQEAGDKIYGEISSCCMKYFKKETVCSAEAE